MTLTIAKRHTVHATTDRCEKPKNNPGAGLSKVFTTLYLIVYLLTRATML